MRVDVKMIQKKKLYLIVMAVLATFLLIIPVGCSGADTPAVDEGLIFLSKRGYISEAGYPTIVGEVKNGTSFSMGDILITASFYCSRGKLLGEKDDMSAIISGNPEIEILAPGETSPFRVALSEEELSRLVNFDVDSVENYNVVGDYSTTDEEMYKSFKISQSTGELNDATGHYEVVGKVKNIGNKTTEQIKVVGAFYDNQNSIIEVVSTYLQDTLLPGDEAQFEITVLDETIAQLIETYHIQPVAL